MTSSIGAPEIAGLLPDDSTALVEYVTGTLGAPTTAFVVTRGDAPARALLLPPADSLIGAIGRFVALVARGTDDRVAAATLGRTLLEPVLALLGPGVSRLVIVPDGPLHRVPWDALRLRDGHYLVERYAIGIVPSAGTLGVLWRRPRERHSADSTRLLVFGDPSFARRPTTRFASPATLSRRWRTCRACEDRAPRHGSSPATRPCPTFGSATTRASTISATRRSTGSK